MLWGFTALAAFVAACHHVDAVVGRVLGLLLGRRTHYSRVVALDQVQEEIDVALQFRIEEPFSVTHCTDVI